MFNKIKLNKRKWLLICAIAVFLAGVVLYMIGYDISNSEEGYVGITKSVIGRFPLSILSSLEMFVLQSDIQVISKTYQNSGAYMLCFILVHFAAACISGILIIHYFGVRIWSWCKWNWLRFHTRSQLLPSLLGRKPMPEMHVFFDINAASTHLATSIRHTKGHESDIIIFVDCNHAEAQQQSMNLSNIINLYAIRRELLQLSLRMNAIVKRIYCPLHEVPLNNACSRLHLEWAIRRKGKCCYYFFSENENSNILSALKLTDDQVYASYPELKARAKIYCRASRSGSNGVFGKRSKGIEMELIDSSLLSIAYLKNHRQGQFQPVHFVRFDETTTLATTPFRAMIIGFGETGQEALKFLYEYGQFIYSPTDDDSQFSCTVVDRDLPHLQAPFTARYSAPDMSRSVRWLSADFRDTAFWDALRQQVEELNYVVISTGSDEANILLAQQLYDFARLHRTAGMERFGIFVHTHSAANERRLSQVAHLTDAGVIHLFGQHADIYKVDYVWKHCQERPAKQFYEAYSQLEASIKHTEPLSWDQRHQAALSSNSDSHFEDLLRKESQDYSNASHLYTKKWLGRGIDTHRISLEDLARRLQAGSIQADAYRKMSPAFLNLSRLEHKRWMAAHEMMGYRPMTKQEHALLNKNCDPLHRKHVCMVSWQELDHLNVGYDVKAYDDLVVLNSLLFQAPGESPS